MPKRTADLVTTLGRVPLFRELWDSELWCAGGKANSN